MKLVNKKRLIIALILGTIVVLFQFFGLKNYITLDYITAHKETFAHAIERNYVLSVVIFLAVLIAIVAFMIPVSLILNIAAGYFFGVVPGALYSVTGSTVGAALSFLAVRYLLSQTVRAKYGSALEGFNKQFKKYGAYYLLSMQLFPLTPFGVINILAGLSPISLRTFVITTAVGIMPGAFIYSFAGRQLGTIESARHILSPSLLMLLVALAFLSLMPVILRRLNLIPK